MIKEPQIALPGCAEKPNLHIASKVSTSQPDADAQFLQRSPSTWLPLISPLCQQKATGAWCLKCLCSLTPNAGKCPHFPAPAAFPWVTVHAPELQHCLWSLAVGKPLAAPHLYPGTCDCPAQASPFLALSEPASALMQPSTALSPLPWAVLRTKLKRPLQSTTVLAAFLATGMMWARQGCCFSAGKITNGDSLAKPSRRWVCCLWAEDSNLQHPQPRATKSFCIVSLWARRKGSPGVFCIGMEIPHQERKTYFMWYYCVQLS